VAIAWEVMRSSTLQNDCGLTIIYNLRLYKDMHYEISPCYVFEGSRPGATSASNIAQREREMIAQRTKEALAVARKRLERDGRRLGNPNGADALRKARKGNGAAVATIIEGASRKAGDLCVRRAT